MKKQTHIKKIKPLKPIATPSTQMIGPGTGGNGEGCIPVR